MKLPYNTFLPIVSLVVSSFTVLFAPSSQAAIIGGKTIGGWKGDIPTTRDIKILPSAPVSFKVDVNESLQVQAFTERQDYILPQDLTISTGFKGVSTGTTTLNKDTLVNSYLLFLDPPQQQRKLESPNKSLTARQWGYVQFEANEEILGIWTGDLANPKITDKNILALGNPNTTYERGRILDSTDRATFDGTRYAYEYTYNKYGNITKEQLLEFGPQSTNTPPQDIDVVGNNVLNFYFNTILGIDPVRIITRVKPVPVMTSVTSVPEPLTMLGAATALGFGTLFKRNLTKKTKAD